MSDLTTVRIPGWCPDCENHFWQEMSPLYAADLASCMQAMLAQLPTMTLPTGTRPHHG